MTDTYYGWKRGSDVSIQTLSREKVFISCVSLRMISHWGGMDASRVAKRLP